MVTKDIEAPEKQISKMIIFRLVMSLLLAGMAAWWSIPYAWALRGYFAIGGEYCLIMWMGVLPWLYQSVKSMLKETMRLTWLYFMQP